MSDDMPQGDGSGSGGGANPAFEHSMEGDFLGICVVSRNMAKGTIFNATFKTV